MTYLTGANLKRIVAEWRLIACLFDFYNSLGLSRMDQTQEELALEVRLSRLLEQLRLLMDEHARLYQEFEELKAAIRALHETQHSMN